MAKKRKKQTNFRIIVLPILVFIFVILIAFAAKKSKLPGPTSEIMPPGSLNTDQTAYVKLAKTDLAAKLNKTIEEVKVKSVRVKEWNDSSLGCPKRGQLYIQSITSGYLIELAVGSKTYIYHGGLNRVVTC